MSGTFNKLIRFHGEGLINVWALLENLADLGKREGFGGRAQREFCFSNALFLKKTLNPLRKRTLEKNFSRCARPQKPSLFPKMRKIF